MAKIEPIIFMGIVFHKLIRCDCKIIELEHENGNTFFTTVPTSTLKFRKKFGSKARVEIKEKKDRVLITIWDENGMPHTLNIHKSLEKEIESIKQSAIKEELLHE